MSDRHIIGKREDGFIIYEEGLFAGLMDNEGNVVISTERHYRSIGNFNNGVAIVYHYDRKPDEGGGGLSMSKVMKFANVNIGILSCWQEPFTKCKSLQVARKISCGTMGN